MSEYLNPNGYFLHLLPFAFSFLILFFYFSLFRFKHIDFFEQQFLKTKNKIIFFLLFTLFCTAEYWILGESSYARVYNEIDSIFPLLKRIGEGSVFEFGHDISGGIEVYKVWHTISQINFNILILKFFNPFVSYALIKILITFIGIYGGYLLLNSVVKNNLYSVFGSLIIFYSNFFSNNVTVFNGIGYASLPLTIYLCFIFKIDEKFRWILLSAYSFFLVSWSSFPHTYFPQIYCVISFGILLFYLKNITTKNLLSSFYFIFITSILFVFNNFPFLSFLISSSDELARNYYKINQNTFQTSFFEIFNFIVSKFTLSYLWLISIIFITIYYLINKNFLISITVNVFLIIILLIYSITQLFEPLNFLSGVRFETMLFALPTIVIFLFFLILKNYKISSLNFSENKIIFLIFFYLFFSSIVYFKYNNLVTWIGEGSYKANLIIEENFKKVLLENEIISLNKTHENNFRSISIWHYLTPGFQWYNNINSFDGISGFFSKDRAIEWVNNNKQGINSIKSGVHQIGDVQRFRCYDKVYLKDYVNFDFLRKNSVNFILSKIQLNDPELVKIYEPKIKYVCKNFIDEKYQNIIRNFKGVDAYIYKINQSRNIFEILDNDTCVLNKTNLNRINIGWHFDLKNCNLYNTKIKLWANLPNHTNFKIIDKNINSETLFYKSNNEIYEINSDNFILIPLS